MKDILVQVGDFGLYQKLLCGIFVFYTTFLCGLNYYTQVSQENNIKGFSTFLFRSLYLKHQTTDALSMFWIKSRFKLEHHGRTCCHGSLELKDIQGRR